MLKKLWVFGVAMALAVSLSACGNQDQEQAPADMDAHGDIVVPQKGQEAVVNVSDDIKSAWTGVKLMVTNKSTNSTDEFTIDLGKEGKIPGSGLTIKVTDFLPSFTMQQLDITSASNEPNNPAAKVIISENGAEVFKGWLFQKFPDTHAFSHPDVSVTLVEGVPAS